MIINDAEEAKAFKENAVHILRKNHQFATAKAAEKAFNVLIAIMEYEEKGGDE